MKKRKVLLTGGSGLLGTYIRNLNPDILSPSHNDLDITNFAQIRDYIDKNAVDTIIHAAALVGTRVCEQNPDKALTTNVEGTRNLCVICQQHQIRLIFISTDYVFDGKRGNYSETDTPLPVNYYGKTKLMAENIVSSLKDYVIIRGSFYDPEKWKFPDAFIDQFSSRLPADEFAGYVYHFCFMPFVGLVHIGSEKRQSAYDIASKINPGVNPTSIYDLDVTVPEDVSLKCSVWHRLMKNKVEH